MSRRRSRHSATSSIPDNLDLQMLHGAQACLGYLQGHQDTSPYEVDAWRWFYKTYDPLVRRFVLAYGLRESDAEDCMQDVWSEVVKTLGAFDSDGTQGRLCSWLHTIVHSKATNFVRYRMRHACKHLGTQVEAGLASREAGPMDEYEHHCLQEAVQRVLAMLRQQVSPKSFLVLWMRAIEQRTIEETAAELQLTATGVRCRYCR